jgi:hypothetical protein
MTPAMFTHEMTMASVTDTATVPQVPGTRKGEAQPSSRQEKEKSFFGFDHGFKIF